MKNRVSPIVAMPVDPVEVGTSMIDFGSDREGGAP